VAAFLQTRATAQFRCLGDACEDTCCQGWGMQLSQETVDLYARDAPGLLDAVTSGEAEYIMKRDPATDYCVKFEGGWCQIHKEHGDSFLGDACHFYPRVTRALGDDRVMTMATSCPEAARLMLFSNSPFVLEPRADDRVPHAIKNYATAELRAEAMHTIHAAFMAHVANEQLAPAHALMQVMLAAQGLAPQNLAQWPEATAFYLGIAESRMPTPQANTVDMLHVLNALQGLVAASKARSKPKLMALLAAMADALGVRLDWEGLQVHSGASTQRQLQAMDNAWSLHAQALTPVLRRYVQAQLSQAFFPFSGFGATLVDRAIIIGARFATLRLALLSHAVMHGAPPDEVHTVRLVQTLSRFMDHLADPAFSMQIYNEVGWNNPARLYAVMGG
jgi:lysine-N-methylase